MPATESVLPRAHRASSRTREKEGGKREKVKCMDVSTWLEQLSL